MYILSWIFEEMHNDCNDFEMEFLCLQHLAEHPDIFEPVAFEKNFWSGGIWNYSDQNGKDDFGFPIHSALYNSLK